VAVRCATPRGIEYRLPSNSTRACEKNRRHDSVGIKRDCRQVVEQRALALEAVRRPLSGRLLQPDVSHFVAPNRRQSQIVLEAVQFITTSRQGVVLDVGHATLDDSFRFRIALFAGD
jgi:hypothetical protein